MTYTEIEQSVEQGNPIELFHFKAEGQNWRYTSTDQHIFIEGFAANPDADPDNIFEVYDNQNVFISVPIQRSEIEQTNDISKSDLQINMARNVPIAERLITKMPENVMSLTIYRSHVVASELTGDELEYYFNDAAGTLYESSNPVTIWKGRVISFSFKGDELTINCESVYTSLKRYGLLSKYQYICRHALYSQGPGRCNVNKEAFKFESTVTAIDGLDITVENASSKENGWFVGGFVYFGSYTYRYVTGHNGDVIRLNKSLPYDIEEGISITMYAGCDHSFTTCRDKFNNLLNYGGFPHIPLTNPFSDLGNALV